MPRRGWKILTEVLAIILVVVLVTFSALRYGYYFVNGEELTLPVVKHFLWPEEVQESDITEAPKRLLTVNPEYDGVKEEFVYVDTEDSIAVAKIHQTITYQYYDDVGNAIMTVKTWSYDVGGKTLSTDYRRQSCKMPGTDVLRTEIEILYHYDTEKIDRCYLSESYGSNGESEPLSTTTSESEIIR